MPPISAGPRHAKALGERGPIPATPPGGRPSTWAVAAGVASNCSHVPQKGVFLWGRRHPFSPLQVFCLPKPQPTRRSSVKDRYPARLFPTPSAPGEGGQGRSWWPESFVFPEKPKPASKGLFSWEGRGGEARPEPPLACQPGGDPGKKKKKKKIRISRKVIVLVS